MTTALIAFAFAVPLFVLGRWGKRKAVELAPPTMSQDARAEKERVIRRGGAAAQVFAGIFVALGVVELVMWLVRR